MFGTLPMWRAAIEHADTPRNAAHRCEHFVPRLIAWRQFRCGRRHIRNLRPMAANTALDHLENLFSAIEYRLIDWWHRYFTAELGSYLIIWYFQYHIRHDDMLLSRPLKLFIDVRHFFELSPGRGGVLCTSNPAFQACASDIGASWKLMILLERIKFHRHISSLRHIANLDFISRLFVS